MTNKRDHELDDEIMAAASQLSIGVVPERDLWAGIESAIEKPRQARWQGAFAQAASIVLLIGASAVTYMMLEAKNMPVTEVVGVPVLRVAPASFGVGNPLGPEYEDARAVLEVRLEQELERLPGPTQVDVRKNLENIRAAIDEINAALAEEPESMMLQKLLMSSYQRELEVLSKVDGFAIRGMPRDDI